MAVFTNLNKEAVWKAYRFRNRLGKEVEANGDFFE